MKKSLPYLLRFGCIGVRHTLLKLPLQRFKLFNTGITENLLIGNLKLLFCILWLSLLSTACRKDKEAGISGKVIDKGTISGTISPAGKAIAVQALDTKSFVHSATLDASGAFKFSDLSADTYSISIVPTSGFTARSSGLPVTVTAGHDTQMGALLLYPSSGSNSLNYLSYNVDGNPGALKTTYSCAYVGPNLIISARTTEYRQNASSLIVQVVVNQLDLILDNVNGVGSYNCKGTSSSTIKLSNRQTSPFGVSPLYTWSINNTGGSGTVQITAIDLVNRTIGGTFTATVVPENGGATGNKVITSGVFANVAY